MISSMAVPAPRTPAEIRSHRRRVMFSSYLGSFIEFYDFLLYGLAASLVFGPLFFTGLSPIAGTAASFGTLAAGYFARPLGGIVFGHFGDHIGRKPMLVITMSLMGVASTLIGLLPTSHQIGDWAAILLVTLRVLQGIAVGGEWGGAVLMTLEHAESSRRGITSSVTHMGGPSGALLATVAMTGMSAALPEDQFLSWGWRVPFLLSAALLLVGLFVRTRVAESPMFEAEKARRTGSRLKERPALLHVLSHRYREVLLLALGGGAAFFLQSLLATFGLTLAVRVGGLTTTTVLLSYSLVTALHIGTLPLFATLSDRVGRRPVMIGGALSAAVIAYPMLWMLTSGDVTLLVLAFLVGLPIVQAAMYGPMAAFMGEAFGTGSRYTGASLGYQISTALGGGLAPLAATGLLALGGGTNVLYVALALMGVSVLSAVSLFLTKETYRVDLGPGKQMGHEPAASAAR